MVRTGGSGGGGSRIKDNGPLLTHLFPNGIGNTMMGVGMAAVLSSSLRARSFDSTFGTAGAGAAATTKLGEHDALFCCCQGRRPSKLSFGRADGSSALFFVAKATNPPLRTKRVHVVYQLSEGVKMP